MVNVWMEIGSSPKHSDVIIWLRLRTSFNWWNHMQKCRKEFFHYSLLLLIAGIYCKQRKDHSYETNCYNLICLHHFWLESSKWMTNIRRFHWDTVPEEGPPQVDQSCVYPVVSCSSWWPRWVTPLQPQPLACPLSGVGHLFDCFLR